jgi:hypothetical protein
MAHRECADLLLRTPSVGAAERIGPRALALGMDLLTAAKDAHRVTR